MSAGPTVPSPWSYRSGDWFGVFGPVTTLLLPPSEKARVVELWAAIDEGAAFETVLDSLLTSGLGALPGFVLLGERDGVTRLIVRGADARARVEAAGETIQIDGPADATWAERTLTGVTSLRVTLGGDSTGPLDPGAEGADLAIAEGLVRVSRVDHPAYVETGEPPVSPLPDAPDADPPPPTGWLPPTEPSTPPPPFPPAPPTPVPGAEQTDHDGLTRTGMEPGGLARDQPGIPGQPMAPSVTKPVARLVISNGESVEVDRVILVGRAPEARRFTTTDQPLLITVPSPLHEISSTHVEIRPGSGADHGSAVVTDMGSTNGTVLVQPGLGPEDLEPGIAVQLIPGATINLGDGVTISVTRP